MALTRTGWPMTVEQNHQGCLHCIRDSLKFRERAPVGALAQTVCLASQC
jgi:hypothetical protein